MKGKTILLRVDFNVPMRNEKILDLTRIKAHLPTIKALLKQKAKVIIISHLGRPEGKFKAELKLDPIAKALSKLLKRKVVKFDAAIGKEVERKINELKPGDVALLENIRFYPGEAKNAKSFASKLAKLGDLYVNDAFSVSHRAHASIEAITKFIPSKPGPLLIKEYKTLKKLLEAPRRPFIVILGGAKVEDKIEMISNFLKIADKIFITGLMAATFLFAAGFKVGKTFVDYRHLAFAKKNFRKLALPLDAVCAGSVAKAAKTFSIDQIPNNFIIFDMGKRTIEKIEFAVRKAKTIFWNGPPGFYEIKKFSSGTKELAKTIANSKALKIAGGGDTISAIKKFKLEKKFSYLSLSGGAALEFLAGKKLPGLVALGLQ